MSNTDTIKFDLGSGTAFLFIPPKQEGVYDFIDYIISDVEKLATVKPEFLVRAIKQN